jgi:ABC-type nickel/cobalt efflux system permease component RcnA
MGSILLLGLLIGMKHAVEADHVAAVASLAGRNQSLRGALRMGLAWGLGHTVALFAVGAVVLSLDTVLPERIALILEFAVGIMLVWLGLDVIRRLIKARIHFHAHQHRDGTQHFHAHSHAAESAHNRSYHNHEHRRTVPLRALAVGLMHGMAGSAALILLTLGEINSLWMALAYMALFGLGSMLGMAALSIIIAVPLQRLAKHLTWAHSSLNALVGMLTIGIGAWVMYDAGIADGLLIG